MRKFKKGDKASHFFYIADVQQGGNGAIWLDLNVAMPEMKFLQQDNKWLHIPLSELEIDEDKKPCSPEKGRSIRLIMTVVGINEKGVVFDIGGGRLFEMSWDDIRNYWGDASVPDIRLPLYNCEYIMNEERLNAYVRLYSALAGDNRDERVVGVLRDRKGMPPYAETRREMTQERLNAKAFVSVRFYDFGLAQRLFINYDGQKLSSGTEFFLNVVADQTLDSLAKNRSAYSAWMGFLAENSVSPEKSAIPDYRLLGDFSRYCVKKGVERHGGDIFDSFLKIEDCFTLEMESVTDMARIIHFVRHGDRSCALGELKLPLYMMEGEVAFRTAMADFNSLVSEFMRDTAIFRLA